MTIKARFMVEKCTRPAGCRVVTNASDNTSDGISDSDGILSASEHLMDPLDEPSQADSDFDRRTFRRTHAGSRHDPGTDRPSAVGRRDESESGRLHDRIYAEPATRSADPERRAGLAGTAPD